jgi:hypothetical protein
VIGHLRAPFRFTPGERAPGNHWIECWVGPIACLDDVEKRKFLTLPGLEHRPLGCPSCSQYLYIMLSLSRFCVFMLVMITTAVRCELQSDRTLRMRFTDLCLDKFWVPVKEEYPAIHREATHICCSFLLVHV